jgi:hypothetical protein
MSNLNNEIMTNFNLTTRNENIKSIFSESFCSREFYKKIPLFCMALFLTLFITTVFYTDSASAQTSRKFNREMKKYYFGPYKKGEFVISIINFKVNREEFTDAEYGTILVGGLLLSYKKAKNNENVAVAVVDTNDEIIAISIRKSAFRDFLNGSLSQEKLLDEMVTLSINSNELNEFKKTVAF